MFLAAFASLRSPESKAFYDRKRAEGKRHNAAVICLARRPGRGSWPRSATVRGFANGDKLASYAGLAPVTRQSGKSINGESKSRRGNHRLKNAMFLAAFASLRSPDSKAFYDRKRAEGKRHNAAVMCLARRRCNVILAMLATQTPYQTRRKPAELAEAA